MKYADGTDTGWQYVEGTAENSYPFIGVIFYRVIGNIATVQTTSTVLKEDLTSSYKQLVSGLMSRAKPRSIIYFPVVNLSKVGIARIDTNGNLHLFKGPNSSWSTSDAINISATYMVG